MSHINISELKPIGSDLFYDSESFLNELTDEDITSVAGGMVISQVTVTAGYPGDSVVRVNYTGFSGINRGRRVINLTGISDNWQKILRILQFLF
jgi:hypothetical protein